VTSTAFKRTVTPTATLDAFPSVATFRNFARFPPGSTVSGTHAQSLFAANAAPENVASNTAAESALQQAAERTILGMECDWNRAAQRVERKPCLELRLDGNRESPIDALLE
jgi:hypothetical protein